MAFIRLKRVGKEHYAYLVDNVWTPRGPRQRVKRYLGKYLELPGVAAPSAPQGTQITPATLVAAELRTRGFTETLHHTSLGVKINMKTCTVKAGTKNIVLGINGGFLCNFTLRRLVHFQPVIEVTPGYALARAFSDAGIRVGRQQFVAIYGKAYKKTTMEAS